MGMWLASHLKRLGYRPVLHDIRPQSARRAASRLRCGWVSRLEDVERDTSVSFVAVGSEASARVILKLADILSAGSSVIDISSVKTPVAHGLRRLRRDIIVVFIHPLFGPGASGPAGRHVIFTPFRSPHQEEAVLKRFFGDAYILRLGYREHDLLMAYCMAVPRLVSLALLHGWLRLNALELTSSQRAITAAAATTLSDSPKVFSEIVALNPYTKKAVGDFLRSLQKYAIADRSALERDVRFVSRHIPRLDILYKKIYQILDNT